MDWALLSSFVVFAVVMSITPGPNNLMMMSSSALFGARATLPHWLGIQLGFNLLLVAAVFGLGELVARYPQTLLFVRLAGAAWLGWLAWSFARAGLSPGEAGEGEAGYARSRPLRLHEGALFQLINPKAWLMTVSAAAAYIGLASEAPERALIMVGVFVLFGSPCGLLWVMAGGLIRRWLGVGDQARWLNLGIAVLLAATIALILFG